MTRNWYRISSQTMTALLIKNKSIGWLSGLVGGIRALGPAKVVDRLREIAADLDGVYGRDQTGREHLQ